MEEIVDNPLKRYRRATKSVGKQSASFGREDDAERRVVKEKRTMTTSTESSKKTLIQRIVRSTARRQPTKSLLVSFAISVILSALGPLIFGFELTAETKGWRSRGSLVANREMLAEVLNLNRYLLFRDEDGSHWKLVTETVTKGWLEFHDRANRYADPKGTDRRRLDLVGGEPFKDSKANFSIERHGDD